MGNLVGERTWFSAFCARRYEGSMSRFGTGHYATWTNIRAGFCAVSLAAKNSRNQPKICQTATNCPSVPVPPSADKISSRQFQLHGVQYRDHASASSRRFSNRSPRRYAASTALSIACANAISTTSRGKFVRSAAQSRKVDRKPCTVISLLPIMRRATYAWCSARSIYRPQLRGTQSHFAGSSLAASVQP